MSKFFTFLILIIATINLFAQTDVSGNQSGIWGSEGSPYNVIGDITVSSGQSLTIEAGVEVNFQGYYKLTVLGTLIASGTETDSIFFTTDNQSTGWGGISLGTSIGGSVTPASGVSNFSYCRFEYGKSATTEYPDIHGGAIRMIDTDAIYSNCIFADNKANGDDNGMGGAIYAINVSNSTSYTDCEFLRNYCYGSGGAIEFTSALNVEITRCKFIENSCLYGGGAILFYSTVDTQFSQCLFTDNYTSYNNGGAIKTEGSGNTLFFKNCTMVGNESTSGSGGAAALYYADADFVNCIVYNNSSQYDDDNVYIDAGTGTVNYCNMIMPEYNTTGSNNIETDPLFIDSENGDYHLQASSPCIDAGTDIGLPFAGTAPDMGCFETGTISNKEINNYKISAYPNPTNDVIYFSNIIKLNNSKIEITDISGKLVKNTILTNNFINISELKNGIYFLKTKEDNKIYINRIIKK